VNNVHYNYLLPIKTLGSYNLAPIYIQIMALLVPIKTLLTYFILKLVYFSKNQYKPNCQWFS